MMEKAMKEIRRAGEEQVYPLVAIFGGAKVSGKIESVAKIAAHADVIILGGVFANTALKAEGYDVGSSVCEGSLQEMESFLDKYQQKVILPIDFKIKDGIRIRDNCSIKDIHARHEILDVGEQTMRLIYDCLRDARMVIWNGPIGHFEDEEFKEGTIKLAHYLAECPAEVIVGGDDTIRAIKNAGVKDKINYVLGAGEDFLSYISSEKPQGRLLH
jgi:phosphoglycerate kinase